MANDLGSSLPASIIVIFQGRLCTQPDVFAGYVSPRYYTKTIAITDIDAYKGLTTGHKSSHPIHDVAWALFDGTTDPLPANHLILDALAKQIATDWYGWRMQNFDIEYNGIVGLVSTGFHDFIEWNYGDVSHECNELVIDDDSYSDDDSIYDHDGGDLGGPSKAYGQDLASQGVGGQKTGYPANVSVKISALNPMRGGSAPPRRSTGDAYTRTIGVPYNGEPEELGHAGGDCPPLAFCGPPTSFDPIALRTCHSTYSVSLYNNQVLLTGKPGTSCCITCCPAVGAQLCVTVTGCISANNYGPGAGSSVLITSGATVHVTGPGGFDMTCTTDSTGRCCVPVTLPGAYTMTASYPGFTSSTITRNIGNFAGLPPGTYNFSINLINTNPYACNGCLSPFTPPHGLGTKLAMSVGGYQLELDCFNDGRNPPDLQYQYYGSINQPWFCMNAGGFGPQTRLWTFGWNTLGCAGPLTGQTCNPQGTCLAADLATQQPLQIVITKNPFHAVIGPFYGEGCRKYVDNQGNFVPNPGCWADDFGATCTKGIFITIDPE